MIVIPMAGLSSRFFNAGYDRPKYQLPLGNESMFAWSVSSFREYFTLDKFIFIYRDVFDNKEFLESEIAKLGILHYELICLNEPTLGQADTVYQALKQCQEDNEIFIFNIDSKLLNFIKPNWLKKCSGYLEVFDGVGDHWSFVEPKDNLHVLRTTEKERISNLCSNGLYYFDSLKKFNQLVEYSIDNMLFVNNELYIAPLYNLLIADEAPVYYKLIDQSQIEFCGTPNEYNELLKQIGSNQD